MTVIPPAADTGHDTAEPHLALAPSSPTTTGAVVYWTEGRVRRSARGRRSSARVSRHGGPGRRARTQVRPSPPKGRPMAELLVDFITSLDAYGAAEGWP